MNKKIRIILITLISTLIIFNIPLYSRAKTFDEIFNDADSFLQEGDVSAAIQQDDQKIQDLSNTVSGVLLTIAMAVTFISIAVMGINFAIQSVEDKAKIKEAMIPWVIGVFVSFGAYGIWKITMSIFYKLL